MATKLVVVKTEPGGPLVAVKTEPHGPERVQKLFDDLEAQKTVLSKCTELFTSLSSHFSSLQDSLSQKSQFLDSKFHELASNSKKTLESLEARESSIPERESAAAARIEVQREAALADFVNPASENADLVESLRSLCRKMDASGLLKFIVSKRKESVTLRTEISPAIAEAVDPPRLVLDAVEEFIGVKAGKAGVTDKRWACAMLVQALFPEVKSGEKSPEFSRSMVERAAGLAEAWKEQVDGDAEGRGMGPAEAVMFLQMIIGFGLRSRFDEDFLRKLVIEYASRRDMAKLAAALEFGEKMGDIIEELVKSGKEVEAVYFAFESNMTERFAPVPLLKSYYRNSKKRPSNMSMDEASTVELNSIRSIIKCVDDHKLEADFPLDGLRKRATNLEKSKAERRKNSGSTSKPPNKRAHGGGGGSRGGPPPYRPAKAARYSNAGPSFSRRTPAPPQRTPAARYSGAPYTHPGQIIYEINPGPAYATTYRVAQAQPSPAIPQQHYPVAGDNMSSVGAHAAYGGQTSYEAYDYSSTAPPSYQPSYTQ